MICVEYKTVLSLSFCCHPTEWEKKTFFYFCVRLWYIFSSCGNDRGNLSAVQDWSLEAVFFNLNVFLNFFFSSLFHFSPVCCNISFSCYFLFFPFLEKMRGGFNFSFSQFWSKWISSGWAPLKFNYPHRCVLYIYRTDLFLFLSLSLYTPLRASLCN